MYDICIYLLMCIFCVVGVAHPFVCMWRCGKARTEQLLVLVDWASAFRRYLIVCHLVLARAFVLWVVYIEYDAHMHACLLPAEGTYIFYENLCVCICTNGMAF